MLEILDVLIQLRNLSNQLLILVIKSTINSQDLLHRSALSLYDNSFDSGFFLLDDRFNPIALIVISLRSASLLFVKGACHALVWRLDEDFFRIRQKWIYFWSSVS